MWRANGAKKGTGNGLVAVAINKDKGSQHALRWAVDNLLSKGQTVVLVHVVTKPASIIHGASNFLSSLSLSPVFQSLELLLLILC